MTPQGQVDSTVVGPGAFGTEQQRAMVKTECGNDDWSLVFNLGNPSSLCVCVCIEMEIINEPIANPTMNENKK